MRPDVRITEANGALGRVAPEADGTTLLICSAVAGGSVVLDTLMGPFYSVADAETATITEAADATNLTLLHKHIVDFYDQAGDGVELYVLPVAKTVLMKDMVSIGSGYADEILPRLEGKVKLVIVARVPDTEYEATYTGQFDKDVFDAVTAAMALRDYEFGKHRPVSFVIEGRDFQGNVSSTLDLRSSVDGPNTNRVGIAIFNDHDFSSYLESVDDDLMRANYAAAGYAGGRLAGIAVQRNMGRVKDGKRSIVNAGLSSVNVPYSSLSDANVETLHDHGYIFLLKHAQKAGFFFNDDPAACPLTDDYSSLSRGRVMDKVARITRAVLLEELNDDVMLDSATGKLAASTIKHFQGLVESAVNANMTVNGEIVKVSCFIDANQNIFSTDKIAVLVKVMPTGMTKFIDVTLQFDNPLAV